MKKVTLFSFLVCVFSITALAQPKEIKKNTATHKNVSKKTVKCKADDSTLLSNTTNHSALAPQTTLRIADPTVERFNQRASGGKVPISSSGIAGMPKGSYGFANGHILLRNTTATSPGTSYGSGAVGTGTAIQGIGTSEVSVGVNGKSPYAGPWLWGDKQPAYPRRKSDTANHR
jgi:hypothetical protein